MAICVASRPEARQPRRMTDRPLSERLTQLRERHARDRRHVAGAYDRMIETLIERDVVAGALKVGDMIPDFALPASDGRFVRSADLLAQGPLVISFYRGSWCFYCESELTALRDAYPAILAAGGRVIAVAGDVRSAALGEPPGADVYFSYRQMIAGEAYVVVRSQFGEGHALAAAERAVRRSSPHVAVFRRTTLPGRAPVASG